MPSTKITVAALAGAVVTIVVWLVSVTTSVEIPPLVVGALVTVVSFGLGYIVREPTPTPPS